MVWKFCEIRKSYEKRGPEGPKFCEILSHSASYGMFARVPVAESTVQNAGFVQFLSSRFLSYIRRTQQAFFFFFFSFFHRVRRHTTKQVGNCWVLPSGPRIPKKDKAERKNTTKMTDRAPVRQWDPWKLMNVSTEELKAIDERKQMKNELKAKWQRMSTNPHAGGQGGHQVRCCPVTLRTQCRLGATWNSSQGRIRKGSESCS